ncbi:hypothetical protein [Microbacterium gubbeenense]|uniref:hypothetical protein n=1 Tax=Microbacterium TaxID=33882 RepID=UPI0012F88E14|nr:hypothetical protein [Microbacterium gubbeenense]
MSTSPLTNLSPSVRRLLVVGCIVLIVVFSSGTLWSATAWILDGADAEAYFPGRGGNTSVDAWKTTLLYGALAGFSCWGLRGLLKSRNAQ